MMLAIFTLTSLAAGIILTLGLITWTMRRRMIRSWRSPHDWDTTCAILLQVVEQHKPDGWGMPAPPLPMSEKLAEKDVYPEKTRKLTAFFICNPKLAGTVLDLKPELSAIMPCTWTVREGTDGTVTVHSMNVDLMRRIMEPGIRRHMARVAAMDQTIAAALGLIPLD